MLIALTGGIGSGKTTAAHMFAELDVQVLYADQITRELTQSNTPAYHAIVAHFGTNIQSNKVINRGQLREIIFQDPKQRKWLENLLHPLVMEYIDRAHINHKRINQEHINQATINQQVANIHHTANNGKYGSIPDKTYCLAEIPLFLESATSIKVDRTLLIDCTTDLQITRTTARDKVTAQQLTAILATQASREYRIQHSDDIIDNNGSIQQLKIQVQAIHEKYLGLM